MDEATTSSIKKQLVLKPIQTIEGSVIPGLRKNEEGPCVFYHSPNCLIYSNRPLACKNYPIAFLGEVKQISAVWAKNSLQSCPGIGKGSKINPNELKRLGKHVLKEINTHNNVVKDFNIEATEGNPLNAREALWVLVIFGEKEKQ